MGIKLAFYLIAAGMFLLAIPWAAHRGWLPRMPRLRRTRRTRRRHDLRAATHSLARTELALLNARVTEEPLIEHVPLAARTEVSEYFGASTPVLERMGISVTDLGGGWSAAHLPIDGNANHHGTMHSGALFCVGEVLSATLLGPFFGFEDCVPMVKNMAIEHHRPARSSVTATAHLDPQEVTRMRRDLALSRKADWVFTAELRDSEGHAVATMKGECQLRTRTGGAHRATSDRAT